MAYSIVARNDEIAADRNGISWRATAIKEAVEVERGGGRSDDVSVRIDRGAELERSLDEVDGCNVLL